MNKIISIFGSSQPKPETAVYQLAYQLGHQLAQAGFVVATGGYHGTMAGVSQGASAAGGHVIGITSAQIERQFDTKPNRWIDEEIKFDTLRDRLFHLVLNNDALLTLPGGIGTLSEMSLAWSLIQTGEMSPRPLLLLGEMWPQTVHAFVQAAFVREEYMGMLRFEDSVETAVAFLSHHFDHL